MVEANLWNLVMRDFDINEWWMNPVSGVRNNEERYVNLNERNHYQDIMNDIDPTLQRVFLEPHTSTSTENPIWLHDLVHPENCVYIFGSAHYNPTIDTTINREEDIVVTIKTQNDAGVLWSNQCLLTVLYDRYIKSLSGV
jgi:hypothetical protein